MSEIFSKKKVKTLDIETEMLFLSERYEKNIHLGPRMANN